MKIIKKLSVLCIVALMACTFLTSYIVNIKAEETPMYDIVFKGGLHGTVNGKKTMIYEMQAGDIFPNDPSVKVEEGYVFTGWNKELPEVGTTVDRKLVFVAQYDVLVEGISYIVHYVDENNVAIATPKTMMAEAGSKIVERAKVINEYAYQKATQEFVLSEKKKEITFVYNYTGIRENIRYEEEIINVYEEGTPRTTNPGNTGNTPGGNPGDTPGGDANIDDPDVPQGDIEDPKVPQGKLNEEGNSTWMIVGGVGAVALLGLLAWYIVKRKKENEA